MAQPPKKPTGKQMDSKTSKKLLGIDPKKISDAKNASNKLPPMTQKSIDTAAKMDYEDVDLLKKAKGGKVCNKAKGGKVKFDFAKMIQDKKKNAKKTPPKGKGC